ncbi:MAG: hypothetical protein VXW31_02715, partial [Planctomycetota bacterium]|nr:hypothetical protein [Planctomycetota bacterium]
YGDRTDDLLATVGIWWGAAPAGEEWRARAGRRRQGGRELPGRLRMGWLPREEDGSATVEVGSRPATGDGEVEAVLG